MSRLSLLAAVAVTMSVASANAQETGIAVGAFAPGAAVQLLDGKSVDLSQYIGKKPVVLEFWATWCPLCKKLEPSMQAAREHYGDHVAFVSVGVNNNQTPEAQKKYADEKHIGGTFVFDRDGKAVAAYKAPHTSYLVVIGGDGKVVYTGVGPDQDVAAAVEKAFPMGMGKMGGEWAAEGGNFRSMTSSAETSAFEHATLPHLGDVARFARSLTRDETQADDLVQETYLNALRGWHTFREGADAKRWLLSVCHHAFVRVNQREARYVQAPYDDPELESLATATAHWDATQDGVAEVVERMDLKPAIDRALTRISEHLRGAIVLVDVEGQSYEDAALILGVPVGTVRSRLFRGRRLLQDLLFEYARDAGFTQESQ